MTQKKVILIGRGTLAVECLKSLKKAGSMPAAVVCDIEDDGRDTWIKSLFGAAQKLGYIEDKNLFRAKNVNAAAFLTKLKKAAPNTDYIFSIQPRSIFHKPFIGLANKYVYNLHLAPLPKLRGVNTSSWAILDGLKKMGVTIHLIEDEKIDAGPIIFQKLFPITKNETVWSLFNKCEKYGAKLLDEKMKFLLDQNIKLKPQKDSHATYHSLNELNYADSQIPFDESVESTLRFIRSRIFPPLQLPYFFFEKKQVFVLEARGKKVRKPSFIARYKNGAYIIPCADGEIRVTKYKNKV